MRLRLDAGASGPPSCVQLKIRDWRGPGCKQSGFTGRLQAPRRPPPAAERGQPLRPPEPVGSCFKSSAKGFCEELVMEMLWFRINHPSNGKGRHHDRDAWEIEAGGVQG